MCGTGVGFSVERQFINSLPLINEDMYNAETVIQVHDSRIGWATAFRQLIALLYAGQIPRWDLTKLRPKGARLKTFGGRASGPEPLNHLFQFCVDVFRRAAGRKLNSLECHDIVCKIADIVIVGGVRRSALISLSNLSDDRMRNAKNGQWWISSPQRALANNSAAYTEKPEIEIFLKEWLTLIESKSGERGIFNRVSAIKKIASTGRRKIDGYQFGTNPCGEIYLRSAGLCNLSEVVVRPEDSLEDLLEKVRLATIVGTFQSTLTEFRYLRGMWKKNAEEERLLGVSLTGIMDHPVLSQVGDESAEWLRMMRTHSINVNVEWADKLGIEPSAACTCVKPSGTVAELVGTSSGIHPRFAKYYVRAVRNDAKDPLARLLVDAGVPCEPDATNPNNILVFSFPKKSPDTSVMRHHITAVEQLDHYRMVRQYWCEHNPSCTIYVKPDEWLEVGSWIYKNWDDVGGVSFLPYTDHVYQQAPFQEIDEENFNRLEKEFPDVDYFLISQYEKEDTTTSSHELACTGNSCALS
jgi:ribonucleoside-diphosphate reductase alpha chain